MRQLSNKSSAADSLPTFVLMKQIIDLIAPFVTELFRRLYSVQKRIYHTSSQESGT